jgi:hypothetical protein
MMEDNLMKTFVHWSVRRIDPKDLLFKYILEKKVSFPSFAAATAFARSIPRVTVKDELVGKPLLEEVA